MLSVEYWTVLFVDILLQMIYILFIVANNNNNKEPYVQ